MHIILMFDFQTRMSLILRQHVCSWNCFWDSHFLLVAFLYLSQLCLLCLWAQWYEHWVDLFPSWAFACRSQVQIRGNPFCSQALWLIFLKTLSFASVFLTPSQILIASLSFICHESPLLFEALVCTYFQLLRFGRLVSVVQMVLNLGQYHSNPLIIRSFFYFLQRVLWFSSTINLSFLSVL